MNFFSQVEIKHNDLDNKKQFSVTNETKLKILIKWSLKMIRTEKWKEQKLDDTQEKKIQTFVLCR